MTRRPRRRGFTVPEVLIAFLVLSLGLASLYRNTATSARSLAAARSHEALLATARDVMDRAVAGDPTLEPAGTAADGLGWRVERRPFASRLSPLVARRRPLHAITVTTVEEASGRRVRLDRIAAAAGP